MDAAAAEGVLSRAVPDAMLSCRVMGKMALRGLPRRFTAPAAAAGCSGPTSSTPLRNIASSGPSGRAAKRSPCSPAEAAVFRRPLTLPLLPPPSCPVTPPEPSSPTPPPSPAPALCAAALLLPRTPLFGLLPLPPSSPAIVSEVPGRVPAFAFLPLVSHPAFCRLPSTSRHTSWVEQLGQRPLSGREDSPWPPCGGGRQVGVEGD